MAQLQLCKSLRVLCCVGLACEPRGECAVPPRGRRGVEPLGMAAAGLRCVLGGRAREARVSRGGRGCG